jgi:uncharacterized protein
MFSILFRILFLVFVVWLVRRFLATILRAFKRPGPTSNATGTRNLMVKDPVCGMYMDSRLAIRLQSKNEVLYFCSEECRKKYLDINKGEGMGTAAAGY